MKKAVLYRMVTDSHVCPYGIKSKDLLEREGYEVEDNKLTSRQQTDEYKEKYNVKTTPQTFINGKRVGGHDDLMSFFGKKTKDPNAKTYQPIIAVFAMTFLMAIALIYFMKVSIFSMLTLELFIGLSMSVLAILKLRDLNSFSNQFITYDILGKRWVRYAYIYPFAEAIAGVGMIARFFTPLFAIISIVIGAIGGVSVIKAVYIEKRDIKCACVGGESNVPLGFISLTENVMMFLMGIWMLFGSF